MKKHLLNILFLYFWVSLSGLGVAHAQDIQLPYPNSANKCEREANALVSLAEQVNTCDNATDWHKRYLKLFHDCPTVVKSADKLYYRATEQVRNVSLFQCSSDVHHKIQNQIIDEEERYGQKERRSSKDGLTTEEREERDEEVLEAREKIRVARRLKIFDVDDETLFLKFTNEVLYLFEQNGYKLRHVSTPDRLNSFKDNTGSSSDYKFRSISQTLHFENDMEIHVSWNYSNTEGDEKQVFIYPKNEQDFKELVQRKPYQKIANLVDEKQDLSEAKSLTGTFLILINNPVITRLQYEAKEINPILKARFEGKSMSELKPQQEATVSVKEVCERYLQAINAANPTRPIVDIVQNITISETSIGKKHMIRHFKKWDSSTHNFKQTFYHNYEDSSKLKRISVLKPSQGWVYVIKTGYEDKITSEGKAYNAIQEQLYPETLIPTSNLYESKVFVEQREGKTYYRIATKPFVMVKIESTSNLLFTYSTLYDAQTGLKTGSRTTYSSADDKFTETIYSDYQTINGVKYPILSENYEVNEAAGTRTPTGNKTVYQYQINEGIDEEIFDLNSTRYSVIGVELPKVFGDAPPAAPTKNLIPRYIATPANMEQPLANEVEKATTIVEPLSESPLKTLNTSAEPLDKPVVNEVVVTLKECFGNSVRLEVSEKNTNHKIGLLVFGNLHEGENKYVKLEDANQYHREGKVYGIFTTERLKFLSSIETSNSFYFVNGTFLANDLLFTKIDNSKISTVYKLQSINLTCK